jgi:hypothetical protein
MEEQLIQLQLVLEEQQVIMVVVQQIIMVGNSSISGTGITTITSIGGGRWSTV